MYYMLLYHLVFLIALIDTKQIILLSPYLAIPSLYKMSQILYKHGPF
jgi:hypothetical protein